jgi:hypothetical protein
MSQYVRYDPSGAVSPTSRPIGYYIPPPAPVTQGGVIYQDNFTGSGDNTLIYTTPTVTTGGKFWVRNDPSFAANGQAVANAGAYLPFTPVAGNVYTLQGTLNPVSSGGDGWFAFGFTTVGLPFNGSPSWFLVKPSNIGGDVYSVKNGSLTALGNVTNSSNVFTIALNTTGINWVSTFSVNGTVLDTQTFTGGAPAISYIGIYANADTLATGSRITNLELSSVPEPSGGVIALGAAGIFLVRRRRIS